MEQIGIALTGAVAVFLSQDSREAWRKWACLFGMAGQPFWFYATYTAEQWGMFALCFLYAFAWARGIKSHWMPGRGFLRIGRLDITFGMQAREDNGANPTWLGFAYGSWMPKFRVTRSRSHQAFGGYWLCFHWDLTLWSRA